MQSNTTADLPLEPNFTNLHGRYNTLVDLYAEFRPSILLVDRSVTPLWYLLGLVGNLLSTYVWMHPRVRRNNSSAVYLAALSIWDLVFLALHPIQEVQEAWLGVSGGNVLLCGVVHVPLLTAQYLSPVLVLCFTFERWIAICFPFRRDSLCTPKRACIVTVAMVTLVLLWNLVQLNFKWYDPERKTCVIDTDNVYWKDYTMATEAVFSGLVPVTALVFNLLVCKELHRITVGNKHLMPTGDGGDGGAERRFRATTVMLLCVSFFVILTSLPAGLMYALQNQKFGNINFTDAQVLTDPTWQSYFSATLAKKIVDEISISHYSLNFLIYLLTGPQYRSFARQLLAKLTGPLRSCYGNRSSRSCRFCCHLAGHKRLQKEKEEFFLSNSLTDRARRLANQKDRGGGGGVGTPGGNNRRGSTSSQSEQARNGGAEQTLLQLSEEARKPLLTEAAGTESGSRST